MRRLGVPLSAFRMPGLGPMIASTCLLLILSGSPSWGGPGDAGLVFESSELRIYRVLDSLGRPRLLLTNLDSEGNRLAPAPPEADVAPPPRRATETPHETPAARAAYHDSDLEPAPEEREISVDLSGEDVVRVEDGSGTTIIININNPPPAPPSEPLVVPAFGVPPITFGGIVGSYRYPDDQPFLGYSTRIDSISWMGGLGLKAGNGFGLSSGSACRNGFDCMFPPSANPRRR